MEALQKPVIEEAMVADQSTTTTDSRTEEESVGNIEEEDEVSFLDVDLLVEHGIAVDDVRKLQKFGINTIKGKWRWLFSFKSVIELTFDNWSRAVKQIFS